MVDAARSLILSPQVRAWLGLEPGEQLLLLLPGSRAAEIHLVLPLYLEALACLAGPSGPDPACESRGGRCVGWLPSPPSWTGRRPWRWPGGPSGRRAAGGRWGLRVLSRSSGGPAGGAGRAGGGGPAAPGGAGPKGQPGADGCCRLGPHPSREQHRRDGRLRPAHGGGLAPPVAREDPFGGPAGAGGPPSGGGARGEAVGGCWLDRPIGFRGPPQPVGGPGGGAGAARGGPPRGAGPGAGRLA